MIGKDIKISLSKFNKAQTTLRRKEMNKKKLLFYSVVMAICCVSLTSVSYGVLKSKECFSCDVVGSCKGRYIITDSSAPRPAGCTQNGVNCGGNCYRCKNKTAYGFCVYDGHSSCEYDTNQKSLNCGDKYRYACSGLWSSNCSCGSSNGEDTGNACVVTKC